MKAEVFQAFFLTDLRERVGKGDGCCGGGRVGFESPHTLSCPEVVERRQVKLIMRSTDLIMCCGLSLVWADVAPNQTVID